MAEQDLPSKSVLDWLLEPEDPGVRYLALRDLVKAGPAELAAARQKAHTDGPITEVLSHMEKEGFWVKSETGYSPLYTGTMWAITLLAQLGAAIDLDTRIATACAYALDHFLAKYGQFSANGLPSGTIDCIQGNLCYSLFDLGCKDERLDTAYEYMARSATGEGIAPLTDKKAKLRYYAAKPGPVFACSATYSQPCAWGAIKVMLAFSRIPAAKRTPLMDRAIKTGVDFLFSKDPAKADYPLGINRQKPTGLPSGNWWKFGFPSYYVADVLENVEVLASFGYGQDPRLANAIQIIRDKRDAQGRWPLEHSYAGRTWGDFGAKKQPNKWVTLRVLRTLAMV